MHILFGTIRPHLTGGVHTTEEKFIEECERTPGLEVSTFHFGRKAEDESRLRKVTDRFLDVLQYLFLIPKLKPTFVHINSSYDKKALARDVWFVLLSRFLRVRLFIKFHGSEIDIINSKSWVWRFLTRVCIKNTVGLGVLSTEEKEAFQAAGYPANKFHVVKNAVNLENFSTQEQSGNDQARLLFIARFVPTKGLIEVVRATKILADEGRNVTLLCIGDGPVKAEAQDEVRKLGISSSVRFLGYLPEPKTPPYYMSSSMLVFPTFHDEGFPMTVFQSLAAGLPIITTRIRAAADYLSEPDNCLWVEPRNPEMLAAKISRLLDDKPLRDKMALANRELAMEFSPDKIAREYISLYRQLSSNPENGQAEKQ